jgi:hypothetical protein
MKTSEILAAGGLAAGAYLLWRQSHAMAAAAAPHPSEVDACLTNKPNWTMGQCQQRLTDLKSAAASARAQLAVILAPRAGLVAAGPNYASQVAAIDQAASPWQTALAQHQQDYFNLTGVMLP